MFYKFISNTEFCLHVINSFFSFLGNYDTASTHTYVQAAFTLILIMVKFKLNINVVLDMWNWCMEEF